MAGGIRATAPSAASTLVALSTWSYQEAALLKNCSCRPAALLPLSDSAARLRAEAGAQRGAAPCPALCGRGVRVAASKSAAEGRVCVRGGRAAQKKMRGRMSGLRGVIDESLLARGAAHPVLASHVGALPRVERPRGVDVFPPPVSAAPPVAAPRGAARAGGRGRRRRVHRGARGAAGKARQAARQGRRQGRGEALRGVLSGRWRRAAAHDALGARQHRRGGGGAAALLEGGRL